jgi:hypothetical protein
MTNKACPHTLASRKPYDGHLEIKMYNSLSVQIYIRIEHRLKGNKRPYYLILLKKLCVQKGQE